VPPVRDPLLRRLSEEMVKYGLAKDILHALNELSEAKLSDEEIEEQVSFWERMEREVEDLLKIGYRIYHGRLSDILKEERARSWHA